MDRRLAPSAALALTVASFVCAWPQRTLVAQWLKYPTTGVPRSPDGKPNLTAPTPRTPEGRPDFSGMWLTADGLPCTKLAEGFQQCGSELPMSRYGINIGAGSPGGLPYQPWAAQQVKTQTDQNSKDDPHARCLPDTFVRHRQRIEMLAGEKYDEGYRQNALILVLSKDLTPVAPLAT